MILNIYYNTINHQTALDLCNLFKLTCFNKNLSMYFYEEKTSLGSEDVSIVLYKTDENITSVEPGDYQLFIGSEEQIAAQDQSFFNYSVRTISPELNGGSFVLRDVFKALTDLTTPIIFVSPVVSSGAGKLKKLLNKPPYFSSYPEDFSHQSYIIPPEDKDLVNYTIDQYIRNLNSLIMRVGDEALRSNYFIEAIPSYMVHNIDDLMVKYRQSKTVLLVRNPYAVAGVLKSKGHIEWSEICQRIVDQFNTLYTVKVNNSNNSYVAIKYEELCSSPEASITKILALYNLPLDSIYPESYDWSNDTVPDINDEMISLLSDDEKLQLKNILINNQNVFDYFGYEL